MITSVKTAWTIITFILTFLYASLTALFGLAFLESDDTQMKFDFFDHNAQLGTLLLIIGLIGFANWVAFILKSNLKLFGTVCVSLIVASVVLTLVLM